MDPQLTQRTRYLLQARTRRTKTCPPRLFNSSCAHLLGWLDRHPLYGPIVRLLEEEKWAFREDLAAVREGITQQLVGGPPIVWRAASWREHAALSLSVLRLAVDSFTQDWDEDEALSALCMFVEGVRRGSLDDAVEVLRDVAVDALYEYLDEQLDTRNAVMGLLSKYQKRCEWFRRQRLRAIAAQGFEGRPKGERALAVDLQEFVLDQGIDFSIEESSASGEADLVLRDVDGSHLVIEDKYIAPNSTPSVFKRKLRDGFHQVARYCQDFNEPFGFLVVFIEDLKMPRMPLKTTDTFQYLTVKDKTIYYVPVVIADAPSASKAGIAEHVDISPDELLVSADDPVNS